MLFVLTWVAITALGTGLLPDLWVAHRFLTAAILVGLPLAVWLVAVHGRSGLRLDDLGLFDLTTGVSIAWEAICELRVRGVSAASDGKPLSLRYVEVVGTDGDVIRFANLEAVGRRWIRLAEGVVQDIPQAALLLAMIAERVGAEQLYPRKWIVPPAPMVIPVEDGRDRAARPGWSQRMQALGKSWPMLALVAKLGGNVGALLGVGLKTVKLWPAVLSLGAFAWWFDSLVFGAMILLLIGVHECGHVYAMWRSGVPVKGIYFIPFLGGAAVSKGLAKTRWANAFIQINGPIYGTVLTLIFLGAYYATGGAYPALAGLAAWGALINLFNLLPIMPLDGGRLLGEISHSLHRAAGRYAVLGSLLIGGFLAYVSGLSLLWIMVLVGSLEFARQLQAATQKALMDRFGQERPMDYEVNEHFATLSGVMTAPLEGRRREQAREGFEMLVTEARLRPMTGWQTAIVTVGYLGLAVLLVGVMWLVSSTEGASELFDLLR